MPNFNGTGPLGAGPLTGLGRGQCTEQGLATRSSVYKRGFRRFCRRDEALKSSNNRSYLLRYQKELVKELQLIDEKLKEFNE